jgi:hypothetical protein
VIQDANGRDLETLVDRPRFSPEVNQVRLDLYFKAAGALFGSKLAAGDSLRFNLDPSLHRQFTRSGKTPAFILKKLREWLSKPGEEENELSGEVVVKWADLVSPLSPPASLGWRLW